MLSKCKVLGGGGGVSEFAALCFPHVYHRYFKLKSVLLCIMTQKRIKKGFKKFPGFLMSRGQPIKRFSMYQKFQFQ